MTNDICLKGNCSLIFYTGQFRFLGKFSEIKKREKLEQKAVVGFIFSQSGFTKEAEAYCKEKGIASSEDERWLD
jgi:hypothetical protein